MRKIERISVSEADRDRLERLVRDRNTPQKVLWRARIVLLAADGLQAIAIAAEVGTGHTLRDVRSILDAHYLHRDPSLAETAIRKLETRTKTPD